MAFPTSSSPTFQELLKQLELLQVKLAQAHEQEIARVAEALGGSFGLHQRSSASSQWKPGCRPELQKQNQRTAAAEKGEGPVPSLPGEVSDVIQLPSDPDPLPRASHPTKFLKLGTGSDEAGAQPQSPGTVSAAWQNLLPSPAPSHCPTGNVGPLTVASSRNTLFVSSAEESSAVVAVPSSHEQSPSATILRRRERTGLGLSQQLTSRVAELASELAARLANAGGIDHFQVRQEWELNDEALLQIKSREVEANLSLFGRPPTKKSTKTAMPLLGEEGLLRLQAIHPQSRPRLFWNLLAVLFIGYDLISIPLQVFPLENHVALWACNVVLAIFWTLDLAASFLTGVYINGEVERRLAKVARCYLRSSFLFDLVLDIFQFVSVVGSSYASPSRSQDTRSGRVIDLLTICRCFRVFRLTKVVAELLQRVNDNSVLLCLSFARVVIGIGLVVHVLACVWYSAGDVEHGWVRNAGLNQDSVSGQYLGSFQWSLARMSPTSLQSNLDLMTTHEKLLSLCSVLIGMMAASLCMSSILSLMSELSRIHRERNHKLEAVRDFMRAHQVSTELNARVKKWIAKEGVEKATRACGAELPSILPKSLLQEVHLEAWSPVLSTHPFFRVFSVAHRRTECDLCLSGMKEFPCLAGEILFNTGDACSQMFFLLTGEMVYELHKTSILTAKAQKSNAAGEGEISPSAQSKIKDKGTKETLLPDTSVSEAVLWTQWEHCGELAACADSRLLAIRQEDFATIIKQHEQALADVVLYARCYVQELNKRSPLERSDLNPAEDEDGALVEGAIPFRGLQARFRSTQQSLESAVQHARSAESQDLL